MEPSPTPDPDAADRLPGIGIDFLEWQADFLPGASVELVEMIRGAVSLSELYVKPGTILDLELVQILESKVSLAA